MGLPPAQAAALEKMLKTAGVSPIMDSMAEICDETSAAVEPCHPARTHWEWLASVCDQAAKLARQIESSHTGRDDCAHSGIAK